MKSNNFKKIITAFIFSMMIILVEKNYNLAENVQGIEISYNELEDFINSLDNINLGEIEIEEDAISNYDIIDEKEEVNDLFAGEEFETLEEFEELEESDNSLQEEPEEDVEENNEVEIINLENEIVSASDLTDEEIKKIVSDKGLGEADKEAIDYIKNFDLTEINGNLFAINDEEIKRLIDDNFLIFLGDATAEITLSFEDGPGLEKSRNWPKELAPADGGDYTLRGTSGTSVYDDNPEIKTLGLPIDFFSLGNNIVLPTYTGSEWDGYNFLRWEDYKGDEQTHIIYYFQYEPRTYYAIWEIDTSVNYNINFAHYRNKNNNDSISGASKLSTDQVTYPHGYMLHKESKKIPGYNTTKILISNEENATVFNDDYLSPINPYGRYLTDKNSMTIDYSSNSAYLNGNMPNHDIYAYALLEPNTDEKFNVIVNHFSEDNERIKSSDILTFSAEDIVDIFPATIENYNYDHCEVQATSATDEGLYALGTIPVSGEILSPSDGTDTSSNKGRFKAGMINQTLVLNYYYSLISDTVDVKVIISKQQADGTFKDTEQIEKIKFGTTESLTMTIPNYENEGYGLPILSTLNNNFVIESFSYTGGIDGPDGTLYYKVNTYMETELKITYEYDYTSDYWGTILFKYIDPEKNGKGKIEAAEGEKHIDEPRYIKRGKYKLSDLIRGVVVTPDENYICKWYQNASTGIGKTGEAFTNASIIDVGARYVLFASFEKDPDRWIDISFINSENSTITNNATQHIPKGTLVEDITFPTVTTNAGYTHEDGKWVDTEGNILGTTFEKTATYMPYVISSFGGYKYAVKPVSFSTFGTNGKGIIKLYGNYEDRKYVLTDSNDKVLQTKLGKELTDGFTNLSPGKTYHIYECLSSVPTPKTGSTIISDGETISDKEVIGVRAAKDFSVSETGDSIEVTKVSGISYALLDDKYNIAYPWTTSPNFKSLTKGSYYLIVAKESSSNITPDSDEAIKNGVVAYIDINAKQDREHRITIYGGGQSINANSVESFGDGDDAINVYYAEEGTSVTLQGVSGYKWEVLSNNVTLSSNTTLRTTFSMPGEDVIIYNLPKNITENYELEVDSVDFNASLINRNAILDNLNIDEYTTSLLDEGFSIKYVATMRKQPTSKEVIKNLKDKISPYEYSYDIAMLVQGKPCPNSVVKNDEVNATGIVAFDKAVLDNLNYGLENNDGNLEFLYSGNDFSEYGSGSMPLYIKIPTAISYIKTHDVEITSSAESGFSFIKRVKDGQVIADIDDYFIVEEKMKDFFEQSSITPDSNYNAKEYIYDDLYDGEKVYDKSTLIQRKKSLLLKYNLNEDRENAKKDLNDSINKGYNEIANINDKDVRERLTNAIKEAEKIKNNQMEKEIEDLISAKETLDEEIEKALEEAGIVRDYVIHFDRAGMGTPSTRPSQFDIKVALTEQIKIPKTYTAPTNYYYNYYKDKNGVKYKVGNTYNVSEMPFENKEVTLTIVWEKSSSSSGGGSSGGGGSSSGGGGGGGGGGTIPLPSTGMQIADPVQGMNVAGKKIAYTDGMVSGFTDSVVYKEGIDGTTIFEWLPLEQKFNAFFQDFNGNKLTNTWAVIYRDFRALGLGEEYPTYRLNQNGIAEIGLYTEDNSVYYLSKKFDHTLATLQIGWIYDEEDKCWYYANPNTGALVTGWAFIDGKYYYFDRNASYGILGNLDVNNVNKGNGYGKLLVNTITPDGYYVDSNGARDDMFLAPK